MHYHDHPKVWFHLMNHHAQLFSVNKLAALFGIKISYNLQYILDIKIARINIRYEQLLCKFDHTITEATNANLLLNAFIGWIVIKYSFSFL